MPLDYYTQSRLQEEPTEALSYLDGAVSPLEDVGPEASSALRLLRQASAQTAGARALVAAIDPEVPE